jgi:hypothetical protein
MKFTDASELRQKVRASEWGDLRFAYICEQLNGLK